MRKSVHPPDADILALALLESNPAKLTRLKSPYTLLLDPNAIAANLEVITCIFLSEIAGQVSMLKYLSDAEQAHSKSSTSSGISISSIEYSLSSIPAKFAKMTRKYQSVYPDSTSLPERK